MMDYSLAEYSTIINVVLFLILAWTTCFHFLTRRRAAEQLLAPGPYPFPIIGNIHQLLGENGPHRSLAKLSKTYGPLMSLQLGRIYTVVVSSPEMAKEILQKHDQAFSSRTIPVAAQAHGHHKLSVGFLPFGNQWRKLRKLSREQMFSTARLEASEGLRQEKLQKLCDYVRRCCEGGEQVVDISEAASITTTNLMSTTLFSTEVTAFDDDSDATQGFRESIETYINIIATPNLADYFPVLKPFDPQGIRRQSEFHLGKFIGFIQDLINQRLTQQSEGGSKKTDLLETLLDLRGEYEISIQDIKHLLMDLFVAGSDTTSSAVEWAMAELLQNPNKLSKAKQEIRAHLLGEKKQSVEESDISRLPYLQAVIKETLRLYPPGPILMPHKSGECDVQVSGGYTIPKGTQVIVNAWAMGRDPSKWTDPDTFEPERFLGSPIDFKGQHFEFIPFGSGRRICPGLPLADRMAHMMVATLIHNFDWKLEAGNEAEAADKAEMFGLALRRAVPLKAIPINPVTS